MLCMQSGDGMAMWSGRAAHKTRVVTRVMRIAGNGAHNNAAACAAASVEGARMKRGYAKVRRGIACGTRVGISSRSMRGDVGKRTTSDSAIES